MYIEECDVGGDGERGERGATEVPHDDIATSAEQQTPKKDNKPHTPAKLVFLVTFKPYSHTATHIAGRLQQQQMAESQKAVVYPRVHFKEHQV